MHDAAIHAIQRRITSSVLPSDWEIPFLGQLLTGRKTARKDRLFDQALLPHLLLLVVVP